MLRTIFCATVALVLSSGNARAGVPDPNSSSFDSILVYCPAGDVTYQGIVRYFSHTPYPGGACFVDMRDCNGILLCPPLRSDTYWTSPVIKGVQTIGGYDGVVTLPLRAGGTCPEGSVNVTVDGVTMVTITRIASPDQDGDGTVTSVDLAAIAARIGQPYPASDLDGDGAVTTADVDFARQHLGHTCEVALDVRRSTWGELKLLYR